MFAALCILYFAFRAAVVAQSSLSIVCVAGQCVQGYSNTTIGATLSGSELTQRILLLPGQYTTTTNPQLLHKLLTSRSSTLVGSIGFESASLSSLPLNLQLEPGVAIYSESLYSGQASFAKLPESPVDNSSIPLSGKSIAIAPDVWIAVSKDNRRIILWDSVPDTSQLPSTGSLSLLDVQSSRCASPCSGTSVCSASGTCTCPTGFSGSACESCEDGFFGPTCEPCPDGCSNCDQGMSGSGRCLTNAEPDDLPAKCNCLNGLCGSDGQCTCNNGWTTADSGTACAKCAPGFFLSTTGDCQVCSLGCDQCTDGTGDCVTCKSGFKQDTNDKAKCTGIITTRTIPCNSNCNTTIPCPDGTFGQGGECVKCLPFCSTCKGPTEKDCTQCIGGAFFFDEVCRITDNDGICQGTNGMVGNRNKFACDSCGAKCTSCKIPNFYQGSTFDQLQCTDCLPGSFLYQGKCIANCPTKTFAPENDNICTNCSSSCSTCGGSPDFCLTCPSGQFASSGKCISACPSDSFSSSGSCIKCHPDCLTCSGTSFNQCNSCPPSHPILAAGRCLSTCSKTQFLDPSTSTCRACDPSCSSCSGPGSRNCLGCSSSSQVLRGGSCVPANCQDSSNVIPGLGICLSELVEVPSASPSPSPPPLPGSGLPLPLPSGSGSGHPNPLPTVTGLTEPIKATTAPRVKLAWWQILLMTLGGALIFLVLIWCWRRWARKHREKKTKTFAREKNLDGVHGWLVRLGQRLFRGKRKDLYSPEPLHSPKIRPMEDDLISRRLAPPKLKAKELSTTKRDSMDDFISSYVHSPTSSASSSDRRRNNENPRRLKSRNSHLYSDERWPAADHREALRRNPVPILSRGHPLNSGGVLVDNRFNVTDPQAYRAVRPTIVGGMGVSYPNHQSTLSRFPAVHPSIAHPIGPTPGAVQQYPGGDRMPVTVANNGRGLYTLPPPQMMQPFQVTQPSLMVSQPIGATYPNTSSRNPFANRRP